MKELLKVLLVDDELFITKGLSVLLDWEEQGFTIAGTAANGRQALTFLKKQPVDLIIADIQMPVMDGLELAEILRRDQISDAHIVILSGYSEFEYARQAMRFDCMDYLLKPVMTDQLTELLQKVRASCRSSSEGKKRDEVYGKAYLAQNLLALLQDQYDDKAAEYVKSQLRLIGGIRYVYIEVRREDKEKRGKNLRRKLASQCQEIIGNEWQGHLLFDAPPDRDSCGVGLIFCHGMAHEAGQSECDYLYMLYERIRTAVQAPVTLFVGEQVRQISSLAKSYQTAMQVYAVQQYLSVSAPVRFYQPGIDAGFAGISAIALDTLVEAIEQNDKQKIQDTVNSTFGSIGVDSDVELLRVNMDYLLYKLVRLACEKDKAVNEKELLQHLQKNMLYSGDGAKLARLTQFIQEYAGYLASLQQEDSDGVLQKIEQEVRLHYAENLTLKELSQKYYLNSAYLGQLFKKKRGMTFRDYLNSCRIDQAARLLVSTNDKIYNIARAVGYQNLDYFIERFIAAKGCTPSNYRKTGGE